MTSTTRHPPFRAILELVACVWIAIAVSGPAVAVSEYFDPLRPGFFVKVQLAQSDARLLIGGGFSSPPKNWRYSFAVERLNADGTPDTTFNGSGFVQIPIWGSYDVVWALAIQPDGKILVGGNAMDPIELADDLCFYGDCYYPALVRLNADGTLDRSFNGNGRLILTIGDANLGYVQEYGTLTSLVLQPDGKIVVRSFGTAVARVNADGTLDRSFVGTRQVAREIPYAEPADHGNVQGLWWNSPAGSESGWGINFAHQGDVIFASWFTYDATGKPLWLTMTATESAPGAYRGNLYQTRGPAFDSARFDPWVVTATLVGYGALTFSGPNDGRFAYTVFGSRRTRDITRQVFGTLPTCIWGAQPNLALATNYQDLWYAAPAESEAGWGVNFTHQGDTIFATWFTYDADGTPLWLSATVPKTGPGTYAGTLYRTTGPAFDAVPFLPGNVAQTSVGTLTLTFANGNDAMFAYTVKGVTQTKSIVRQVFRSPGTVCQ